MPDVFTKEKRSWVMSRIRAKDTKIELILAKAFRKEGVRYRRHPRLLGTPDFLVHTGDRRALVFVDGDFWHGWDYKKRKHKLKPFWKEKIERNMARDEKQRRALRTLGWKVIRVWEHQIIADPKRCVGIIASILKR